MQIDEKISIIEAVLFASGEPVETKRIAEASNVEEETVHKLVKILNDRYENNNSAIEILKLDDSYQMATKAQYAPYIKAAMEQKRMATLSPAAMEVLTIVAYNQPVTKSFIESVRGVDSSGVVNALVEKDLVEEAGRLEVPGRPIAYVTTKNFLRCFKLASIDQLPPLPRENTQMSFDDVKLEEEQLASIQSEVTEKEENE